MLQVIFSGRVRGGWCIEGRGGVIDVRIKGVCEEVGVGMRVYMSVTWQNWALVVLDVE